MTLVSLWAQTGFGGIFKIIQIYEHYDGANKVQIEQHWVIRQTVLYSEQRKWQQKVLWRKQRELEKLCENIMFVRKEKEDSWLSAIKTKKLCPKGRLNQDLTSMAAYFLRTTKNFISATDSRSYISCPIWQLKIVVKVVG